MGCDQRQLYGGNVRQDLCLRRARKLARTLRSLGAAAQTNAKLLPNVGRGIEPPIELLAHPPHEVAPWAESQSISSPLPPK